VHAAAPVRHRRSLALSPVPPARTAAPSRIRPVQGLAPGGKGFIAHFCRPAPVPICADPRLDLPGHQRLTSLLDLNMLVNVLNKDVLLVVREPLRLSRRLFGLGQAAKAGITAWA
jgi:hypothetical protein